MQAFLNLLFSYFPYNVHCYVHSLIRGYGPVVLQTTEWMELPFPSFVQPILACVCLDKNQGIESVGALFLSEDDCNWKINTISCFAVEQLNSLHAVHLSSLHAGATRNLKGLCAINSTQGTYRLNCGVPSQAPPLQVSYRQIQSPWELRHLAHRNTAGGRSLALRLHLRTQCGNVHGFAIRSGCVHKTTLHTI